MAYTPTGMTASTGHSIVQDNAGNYFISAGRGGYQPLSAQEIAMLTAPGAATPNEIASTHTDSGGVRASVRIADENRAAHETLYDKYPGYLQVSLEQLSWIPQLQGLPWTLENQQAILPQMGAIYDPLLGWIAPADFVNKVGEMARGASDTTNAGIGGLLKNAFFAGAGGLAGGAAAAAAGLTGAGAGALAGAGSGLFGGIAGTGELGGALKGAAMGAVTGGIGGGFNDVLSAFGNLSPLEQQLVMQAGKLGVKAVSGEKIDPLEAAFGFAGPVADAAHGGGLFSSSPVADAPYGDYGFGEDWGNMPGGYSPVYSGGVLRLDELGSNAALNAPAYSPFERTFSSAMPGVYGDSLEIGGMSSAMQGVYDSIAGARDMMPPAPDPDASWEFDGVYDAPPAGIVQQSGDDAIPEGQESFTEEYTGDAPAADDASVFGKVKPSTVLDIAKKLLSMGGNDAASRAAVEQAEKVVNAEYENEEQRRAAYLAYAQNLLGMVPSVSEAYALDPQNVKTAFGDTFVDPKTGEVRYQLAPGTQAYFDALMQAANDTIEQALGTDVDKMTADEFEKAVSQLQGKRDKDFAALTRGLYARGMLGLVTYGESFANPFTGEQESYRLAEGQGANPYFAAYQAGIERENYELANKARGDAESYLQQLLNHSGGLFGKAADVDDNMLGALFDSGKYTDEFGETKKRQMRGIYSALAGPEGSFMAQLMGSLPSGKAAAALAESGQAEELRRKALYDALTEALGQ